MEGLSSLLGQMKMKALVEQLVEGEEEEASRRPMLEEVKQRLQMWPMSKMEVEVKEDHMMLRAGENRAEQERMVVEGHKANH